MTRSNADVEGGLKIVNRLWTKMRTHFFQQATCVFQDMMIAPTIIWIWQC